MTKPISEFIKNERNKLNLSQKNFADRLGVRSSTVSKWENGNTIPNAEQLIQICNTFDINPGELFDCKENKKTAQETEIKKKKNKFSFFILGVIIVFIFLIILSTYSNIDKSQNYELLSGNENYVIRGNVYIGENHSIINLHEFNIIDNNLQYQKVYFLDYGIYSDSKVIEHTDNCMTYKVHQNDELYQLGKYAKYKVRTFIKSRIDYEEGVTKINKNNFYLIVNYLTENKEINQIKIPLKLKEI